ncbi:MAG: hypothetical protein ACI8QT_000499 [Halioglobus sp.]|jgi:hypothetical protein
MLGISQILSRYRIASDPLRSERKIELAALVLTMVLMFQVAYGVVSLFLSPQPSPILPSPDSLQIGTLRGAGLVTAQHSNDLRARPVFWSTRRPVSEEPTVAVVSKPQPAKKNELDAVKVLGVIGSGNSAVVIALVKGQKKRILLGDKVVGWTLESVKLGQAVFTDSGQSQTLTLKKTLE